MSMAQQGYICPEISLQIPPTELQEARKFILWLKTQPTALSQVPLEEWQTAQQFVQWLRTRNGGSCQIPQEEWQTVHRFLEHLTLQPKAASQIHSNRAQQLPYNQCVCIKTIPLKITRKSLCETNHSFIVLPEKTGKYKLGILSKCKIYTFGVTADNNTKTTIENPLGTAKIILWEDDTADVAKIDTTKDKKLSAQEEKIMYTLGNLRSTFIVPKHVVSKRIDNSFKKRNPFYTARQKVEDIDVKNYFTSLFAGKNTTIKSEQRTLALKSANIIKELHERNIIHCDIKPAHFVLNWKGELATIATVNFGFTQIHDTQQKNVHINKNLYGITKYMAPEIVSIVTYKQPVLLPNGKPLQQAPNHPMFESVYDIEKNGHYSKASDIYALGILLKEDLHMHDEWIATMTDNNPQSRPTIETVIQKLTPSVQARQTGITNVNTARKSHTSAAA